MTWPSSNFSTITNSLWAISNSTILAGTPVGIYRSTDSGATWPSVLANDSASSFSSDSTGQQLLAGFKCTTTTGNTGGFRFSTDSGATWGALQNAGTCVASLYALPLTTKQFVATATINGVASVMRSSDIGQTWAALPLPTYGSVGLGPIGVIENQTVFVGTNAGLYQSATY